MVKGFCIVFVCLLLGAVDADKVVDVKTTLCEQSKCDCKAPRNPTVDNMKYVVNLGCHCACGSEEGGQCVSDDDCILGFHCAAGDERNFGKCKDACQKPGFKCDIFDKCVINAEGEPECICKIRPCSDKLIGYGICSFDPQQEKTVLFSNHCLYVNENCNRRNEGNTLERKPVEECADLILPGTGMQDFGILK